jgi:hypothetical protein
VHVCAGFWYQAQVDWLVQPVQETRFEPGQYVQDLRFLLEKQGLKRQCAIKQFFACWRVQIRIETARVYVTEQISRGKSERIVVLSWQPRIGRCALVRFDLDAVKVGTR